MSTLKFEAAPQSNLPQSNSDGPRKKRKRATAQGAADDCFTCMNHNVKCDRRRPYCSQCLDGGQDCAGYKTQLTWGVGVASRGKLRGLSLPVAGTSKTQRDTSAIPPKAKKRNTTANQGLTATISSPSNPPKVQGGPLLAPTATASFKVGITEITPSKRLSQHDVYPTDGREVQRLHQSNGVQLNSSSSSSLDVYHTTQGVMPISADFHQNIGLSDSHDKISGIHFSPYPTPSPTSQYFQVTSLQQQLAPTPISHSYHYSAEPSMIAHTSYQQIQNLSYEGQNEYATQVMYTPAPSGSEYTHAPSASSSYEDDIEEIQREFGTNPTTSDNLSLSSSTSPFVLDSNFSFPLSGMSVVGKTPRMQYLIQYYAEVISPVLVAFDNSSNPLRNHILSMAVRSESLQHAISALSASNIRQRQESGALSTGKTPSARRSSYMHLSLTNDTWDDSRALTVQDRKNEEILHKNAAIQMLNQQLANVHLRKDDTVLATLLMLCLFHLCDSGIANFQTQFAGVKKLLTLRGPQINSSNGDTKWMTRIFTLFDSVAATVNDREGQIAGPYVDSSAEADGEWPYETISGLDSRLVGSISRLGRLNILSQGKSPDSNPTLVSKPIPSMPFAGGYGLNDHGSFDGNGWMRIASDEDLFNFKTAIPSVQEQFWREWREVRHDLQTWSFDNTRFDGSNSSEPYLTIEQRFDMSNISESFRYSALLYTERLANPKVPISDPSIQDWVQRSLYHIKLVRADVYLLWPLFITGAECGDEQEQNVIRERCLDIQKDSGFMNNSSCLALLEKVWEDNRTTNNKANNLSKSSSTFKFRDVMLSECTDGEWIVV